MNWRKKLILAGLYLSRSKIQKNLQFIESIEYRTKEEVKKVQKDRLERLLLHAHINVPYYDRILKECGVIDNEKVNLNNFEKIPLLTKDILRKEGKNLYSRDCNKRKPYKNTSGGSTGEPVLFIQDKYYDEWNIATKIYFNKMLGKDIGDKEIKLWGSDRDIIMGNLMLKDRLINYLYNRRFFNSYNLDEKNINDLIKLNNKFKPSCYWSYVDAAFEFSKIILDKKIGIVKPKFIITTIGPLFDDIRDVIEDAFKCPVYNQYGSREVGAIACQCKEKKHLHTFPWFNFVEVVDEDNKNVRKKEEGKIVITNLANYSMPLIRYDIGDVAISTGYEICDCGRNFFSLEDVLGRTLGYFKKMDGSIVHSHFIVQSMFFKSWIKQFQLIQNDYNLITVNIELQNQIDTTGYKEEIAEIEDRIRFVMGEDIMINFRIVDKIKPSKSGKYIYTLCDVKI
jgi:phenylacetate-CoA ligase